MGNGDGTACGSAIAARLTLGHTRYLDLQDCTADGASHFGVLFAESTQPTQNTRTDIIVSLPRYAQN
eukprot:COSAG05_NODE_8046_length_742_cov_0.898911_2_plen_67_part_00